MTTKMKVLFVDDQPEILSGLKRMLRGLRNEWDMNFAKSADEALNLMAESPFDVVVSDMRMPGLDGTQLLTETMEKYPETVRIILSGQADQESVMRAVTPAHQYLSKPCDTETLKATVARACSLRESLSQESLIRLVSQVTTLPSMPHVYAQLLEKLQADDVAVQDVAELIAQDVAMTAKLMQMVNSSFFGLPRRVESPSHAAALLGLNVLKPLVLSAGIFSQFSALKSVYSVELLMQHSMAVSTLAEQICLDCGGCKTMAEDSLLAGLLHDVGQLLLIENIPDEYNQALTLAKEKEIPLHEAEIECLGATHANVGAYLLGLWGLSNPIVEAVAFHHKPSDCMASDFSPLTAVHIANVLVNETQTSCGITFALDLDEAYLENFDLEHKIPEWKEKITSTQSVEV